MTAVAAAKSLQSDSVWPHRQQPTRLPHPWDSPGKNTGVGCHFLLQCMKVKVKSLSLVLLLATPWSTAYQAPPSIGFSRQECWSGVPLPSPNNDYSRYIYWIIQCIPQRHMNNSQKRWIIFSWLRTYFSFSWASLVTQMVKNLPSMRETRVWSLGWEDSTGEGNGYSLQDSGLENPMDRGAWWAAVHGVTESRTGLSGSLSLSPSFKGSVFVVAA